MRLWLWISGSLFAACWIVPSVLTDDHQPLIYFAYLGHAETWQVIGMLSLTYGIPSGVVGWVLHCIAVMIRDTLNIRQKRSKKNDEANLVQRSTVDRHSVLASAALVRLSCSLGSRNPIMITKLQFDRARLAFQRYVSWGIVAFMGAATFILPVCFPEELNPSFRPLVVRVMFLAIGFLFLSLAVYLAARALGYRSILECPTCKNLLVGGEAEFLLSTGKCRRCQTAIISDPGQEHSLTNKA